MLILGWSHRAAGARRSRPAVAQRQLGRHVHVAGRRPGRRAAGTVAGQSARDGSYKRRPALGRSQASCAAGASGRSHRSLSNIPTVRSFSPVEHQSGSSQSTAHAVGRTSGHSAGVMPLAADKRAVAGPWGVGAFVQGSALQAAAAARTGIELGPAQVNAFRFSSAPGGRGGPGERLSMRVVHVWLAGGSSRA